MEASGALGKRNLCDESEKRDLFHNDSMERISIPEAVHNVGNECDIQQSRDGLQVEPAPQASSSSKITVNKDNKVDEHERHFVAFTSKDKGNVFDTSDHTYAVETDEGRGSGLDALFNLTAEEDGNRIQQYISRLENGRLFTLKSSGETGSQLIRLDVYDSKDISNRDKRSWWRYAKVRTQFFTSPTDRKRRLLRQLLDQVADDMKVIPDAVKEIKNLASESGQRDSFFL